jgi:RNA polymerase sigma-70 factor (ECF subfamily)
MDDLLGRARRGDQHALEELCQREWRPVYALAYHALGNVADAQDVTQEVFLRALRSLDRYQVTEAPFAAYLAVIARNLLRNRARQRANIALDNEAPSGASGPEALAVAATEVERMWAALRDLPADQRRVIELRLSEGRSAAETAQLLGRSPDAVRQLQHRALVTLRARLRGPDLAARERERLR